MKICPACQRTYFDETLSFCLEDGSLLSAPIDPNKTLEYQRVDPSVVTQVGSYVPAPTQAAPTAASLSPQTGNADPNAPPFAQTSQPVSVPDSGWHGAKLFVIFIFIALGTIGFGIALSLIVNRPSANSGDRSETRDGRNVDMRASPNSAVSPDGSKTEQPIKNATPEPTRSATDTPTPERSNTPSEPRFSAMLNNVSFSGDNLTYYRGSTAAQCRADCARNPRCVGFTYIKAEGYNPGDPPMCYLAARITSQAPHKCCISARKQ